VQILAPYLVDIRISDVNILRVHFANFVRYSNMANFLTCSVIWTTDERVLWLMAVAAVKDEVGGVNGAA
jgi:hypothetical protein